MGRLHQRITLCLLLTALSCKINDNARMLTLRSAVLPSSDCSFTPENDAISAGYYDPWVNSGGGATFGFVAENFLASADAEALSFTPTNFIANTEVHRHDLQLDGVEGCFFLTNGLDDANYALRADGSLVDCASLPAAQQQLEVVGITATEGSTSTTPQRVVVTLNALQTHALQALFGDSFDPTNIPVVGAQVSSDASRNSSVAGQPQDHALMYSYSYTPAEPVDVALRSKAWGDKYPRSRQAKVMLQLRLRGRLLNGGVVRSNWLNFPVEVCPGCQRDICGTLVQEICARGVCTDGTPCMEDGTCAAGAPVVCTPVAVFSGKVPNFNGDGACLMAQRYPGGVAPTCEAVGCEAN